MKQDVAAYLHDDNLDRHHVVNEELSPARYEQMTEEKVSKYTVLQMEGECPVFAGHSSCLSYASLMTTVNGMTAVSPFAATFRLTTPVSALTGSTPITPPM